jgi:transporter family-2 protein
MIYYGLAIVIGILISLMIQVNGELSRWSHILIASLIVHIVGSIVAFIFTFWDRGTPFRLEFKWVYWAAGGLGAGVIALNSLAFLYLGVALTVGVMFTTQTVLSLWLDAQGAFGRERIPWNPNQIPGLLVMLLGLLFLLIR